MKHTFISTGMSEEKDIEKVNIFLKNCPFELMHCVSKLSIKSDRRKFELYKHEKISQCRIQWT